MRILTIANNFPSPLGSYDGMFNLRHVLALTQLGHKIRVIRCVPLAPPLRTKWKQYRAVPDCYQVDGIDVRTLRALMPPRNFGIGTLGFQLRKQLVEEIRAFAPDIVHAHGLLPAGIMARGLGVPCVITGHGTETYRLPYTRHGLERTARAVLRDANAVVGVSEFVATHLRRFGAMDVRVIFNGADETLFAPRNRDESRRKLKLPDAPIVAFVGQLRKAKGIFELVRAAAAIADLRPHVIVAGSGPDSEALEHALTDAGVTSTMLGVVAQDGLGDVYAASDLVALPSYAEGLPTVLCEAMLSARSIVATDVGGIPEIVRDEFTGFTVPKCDADALAQRMRRVLTDAALRASMERNAREFALSRLTWSANAEAYDIVYRTIASPEKKQIAN